MEKLIFSKANQYKCRLEKGEEKSFPFAFVVAVCLHFLSAQYGIQNWLQPSIQQKYQIDSKSYIHLYGDSHITLSSKSDSIEVTDSNSGFLAVKNLKKGEIKFRIEHHQSDFKLVADEFQLLNYTEYKRYAIGYNFRKDAISLHAELSGLSKSKTFFRSAIVYVNPKPWIKVYAGTSKDAFYNSFSFKYSNFIYNLDNLFLEKIIHKVGLEANSSNYF